MFFIMYLRRELRRRMRQAIVIALGLAIGVGLVITVTAASAGVKKAQAAVLSALYGIGTDVTVTGAAPGPPKNTEPGGKPSGSGGGQSLQVGPGGAEYCRNGKCRSAAGLTIDHLISPYTPLKSSMVAAVARLDGVAGAAGGLTLSDTQISFPKNFGKAGSGLPQPRQFTVDGVDVAHRSLGPFSSASITSGRSFTAADAHRDVAVLDHDYAIGHKLKTGSVIRIDKVAFTVIGIVRQPEAAGPPDVYVPLARVQPLSAAPAGSLRGRVNTIYVTAVSAARIPAVAKEISSLLPAATVTTAASLASQVTGSAASAARLAGELGTWLAAGVLIAAFAVACLLTLGSVTRRATEFGTLKALGWRSRRIMWQVLGESAAVGLAGAAAGAGLGLAGAALISAFASKLSAQVPAAAGGFLQQTVAGPGGAIRTPGASPAHTVLVPLSASVSPTALTLAIGLALLGGLLAGAFASWRIARLRPAVALTKVA